MKENKLIQFFDNRFIWMLVALLGSFVMWIYVISVSTDEITQNFYYVPVEFVGADSLRDSKNLVITDADISTVTVTVTGPRREVSTLDSKQMVAQVDVSRLTQAAYTTQQVTVNFSSGVTNNVSVQRCMPETVNFMVSHLMDKTVPVRGGYEGQLADGYTAESPVFEPSTVVISGPEAYLRDVDYAWVTFGQDVEASSTYSIDTSFTLMDKTGEPCSVENLSYSTDTINATLPILEVKQVPLSVDIIEGAGAQRTNTKIDIEPQYITLAGDSAILSGLNTIILDTIDLTDFASTYTETYSISIPNGLKNITGVTEATVKIEITGLETRTFTVSKSNLSCINITEGTEVEILTEVLEVRLRATPEVLDQIRSENIRAVADLVDYLDGTGTYMPTVKFYFDGSTDVGAIGELGDYTISIEIRKAAG